MKIMKTALVVLALCFLGATLAPGARADQHNKKTVMTFDQPVEIPGQVLPAGTYMFKLANSPSDRHIVQVWNADGSHLIATVLAINNYRLQPTGHTVVKFSERPGNDPEALKAWFYPGDNFGQEFVYPKPRAVVFAMAEKEPIPALAADNSDIASTPIIAETPDQQEVPVATVIETAPPEEAPAPVAAEPAALPKTASAVPLIALLGLVSLGLAFLLKRLAS